MRNVPPNLRHSVQPFIFVERPPLSWAISFPPRQGTPWAHPQLYTLKLSCQASIQLGSRAHQNATPAYHLICHAFYEDNEEDPKCLNLKQVVMGTSTKPVAQVPRIPIHTT
jgi:hypothetical protein